MRQYSHGGDYLMREEMLRYCKTSSEEFTLLLEKLWKTIKGRTISSPPRKKGTGSQGCISLDGICMVSEWEKKPQAL